MRLILILLTFALPVFATEYDSPDYSASLEFAQVTHVAAVQNPDGNWCFYTTVRHNDQGWKHYADGWQVLDSQGKQLGYRLLAHPHDNEQPFTRRQCNIQIPKETSKVIVQAKCNKHGYGGKSVVLDLNTREGKGYTIESNN